jgi:DNA-binding response OmpR family regulator
MTSRLHDKRIWVAIGDESLRGSLGTTLEREGAGVSHHTSAARVWDALARERPDLLIIDVELPGLSQIDLDVRTDSGKPHAVPVLLVSADPLSRDLRGPGEMPLLCVPFTRKDLLDRILALLER